MTGEGKGETLSPLTDCADGSPDDSEAGSKSSGVADNGWTDVETRLDERDDDNVRPDVETGLDE